MNFKILKELDAHYDDELTVVKTDRIDLFKVLERQLKTRIGRASDASVAARGIQHAKNTPANGRVKSLVEFHESQQKKWLKSANLDKEVIRRRQWLFRMNATLSPNGSIIWPKSSARISYDTELAQQNMTKITFRGSMLYQADGSPLDTTKMVTATSGPGMAIYVLSAEGNLHISSHSVGDRHHSSLLAGANVAGAGEIRVINGKIQKISNKSGHYRPDALMFIQTLNALKKKRVDISNFSISYDTGAPRQDYYENFEKFLEAMGFDDYTLEKAEIVEEIEQLPSQYLAKASAYMEYIPDDSLGLVGSYKNIYSNADVTPSQVKSYFSEYIPVQNF